jgi:hypothetical protein
MITAYWSTWHHIQNGLHSCTFLCWKNISIFMHDDLQSSKNKCRKTNCGKKVTSFVITLKFARAHTHTNTQWHCTRSSPPLVTSLGDKVLLLLGISTTVAWNISHSEMNSVRYKKNRSSCKLSICYSCQILMKLNFLDKIKKKKILKNKISCNPFSVSQVVICRQTNMMKLTVTFWNSGNMPKSTKYILQIKKSKQEQWEEYGRELHPETS